MMILLLWLSPDEDIGREKKLPLRVVISISDDEGDNHEDEVIIIHSKEPAATTWGLGEAGG